MERPPNPLLAMLLWQVSTYALLPVPFLACMAWAYRGGLTQYWTGFAAAAAWEVGGLWLYTRLFKRGFRNDDDTGGTRDHAADPMAVLAPLKLPREFKDFAIWSFLASLAAPMLTFESAEVFGFLKVLAAMTVLWLIGIGCGWLVWSRGGLRYAPGPQTVAQPEGTVGVVLVRDLGDDGDAVWMRWRAVEGCTIARLVHGLPKTGILPSITGGERQWEVVVDGEPVAVITQSWTGSEWWPEPEWFVDPETPFAGERVTLALRESQAR